MLFHWYLFVFLIIFYAVARMGNQRYQVYVGGEYEGRYKWFTALVIIAVLTYVATMRATRFGDTGAYIRGYLDIDPTWDSVVKTFQNDGKDKGFTVAATLLKMLIGDSYRIYLGVIAGFCLLCVFFVYRKHSSNLFMTTFLFLASGEYVQWTHNGMRQFIAVSMIFAATNLLLKKRYVPYVAIILLATTFHASAFIMLPVIFVVQGRAWNLKSIAMLLAVLAVTSSSNLLNELLLGIMENSQYSNDVDALMSTGGTNPFRVAVFAIPPLMALLFRNQINRLNIPIINLSVNMSIVSFGVFIISMFTSGIYIGRMPIYFSLYNYLLLPWVIERFFEKRSSKLIYLIAICCYMVFYYYQMHVIWSFSTSL